MEAFDELGFVDDDFAACLEAVENDLIDAYVRGELDEGERARFESHYRASPRRREKVKFAQALQSFAEQKILAGAATASAAVVEVSAQQVRAEESEQAGRPDAGSAPGWRALLSLFTVPNLTLQWGLAAAAMLLLVAGGWLVFETLRLRGQLEQGQSERATLEQRERELQAQLEQQQSASAQATAQLQEDLRRTRERLAQLEREQEIAARQGSGVSPIAPNIIPFTLAPQTRAPGRAVTLTIPSGTDYITLQLELEPDDYPAYRAELRTQTSNQRVWSSGKLKARSRGENKVINISIRADRLTTRGYILMLKGIAADGSAEDAQSYAFRVIRQ
ncbi:MAG TPA: zf-HC2 domain-containing protein [Blastocatellia bacterium]|nr:zf-HC2 domain-containing protein [Blastocatellia bacterium]